MKKKTKKTTYREGKVLPLIERIAKYYKEDPELLKMVVLKHYPELKDKSHCANCGASMAEYVFSVDCLDALLLYGMGKIVKARVAKGVPFPEANAVHVQSELNTYYSVPSRTTQCAKLGLITKVMRKEKNGKTVHDQKRGWLITERGWKFLRGEPVPAYVKVFRNEIIDRTDDVITIDQAFQKNASRDRYGHEIDGYKPSDWYHIDGMYQGQLL